MTMEALLDLDEVAQRTGQPVRRLRQWCATGSLRCERDGREWLIPEAEVPQVIVNAAERTLRASNRSARAIVVPNSAVGSADLGEEVARRLQRPAKAVSINKLMIDGQEYVIATWPDADEGGATPAVAELAEELGGELLA
jgi:excisionase family DNA binding protein